MWNSTDVGAVGAIVANSLIMTLPWWGYRAIKRKFDARIGYASLILFWMSFEYIHLNWQLSWPWLTLGNVFALHPQWVQWYEITGTSGGTLWVMAVNIFVFILIRKKQSAVAVKPTLIVLTSILIIPFIISFFIDQNIQQKVKPIEASAATSVAIIQPNIDPYGKFGAISTEDQLHTLLSLSQQAIDSTTQMVIWPETALSANVEKKDITTTPLYKPVMDFVQQHPGITLITGVETYAVLGTQKTSEFARVTSTGIYYDSYNATIALQANTPVQFYAKSKLVPGVETLPTFLNFMAPVFEHFGGTTGGYAKDTAAVVFSTAGNIYTAAPVICYESIYGDYLTDFFRKGANVLVIMTNDGWWGNTPGHKQHLQYARLRAIEARKWVVRSANTGISAVIDAAGNITQTQPWDKAAFIKANVPANPGETFFVRYGDILSKAALLLAGLLLVIHWYRLIINRRK
jgi:apolipoprotein N-acyltransferase